MDKKILLVDDDPSIVDLYKDILQEEGFTVTTAVDGEDALLKIGQDSFDLILLDIMMPKLDGITVLTKIKEDPKLKDIPVVMLTNFGQESLVRQAVNLGCSEFLLKYRITPGEMLEKIKQVLSPVPVQL